MNTMKKNNCHYRACKTRTDNLSRIKKEVAEIFGSKLSFCPKMTEKGLCPKMTEKGLRPKMTEKKKISGRSLEFFAFAKNRDDSSLFLASPQRGRSMVEMLGVLAIVGVLSVGGIAGYSKAMMTMKINKTIEQISHMAAAIKTAYMNQGTTVEEYEDMGHIYTDIWGKYGDLDTSTTIAIGAVPTEMVSESGNTLQNVFGGSVRADLTVGRDGAYGSAFSIHFLDIPKTACIALATYDWTKNFQGIAVGNKEYFDYSQMPSTWEILYALTNYPEYSCYASQGNAAAVIGCAQSVTLSPADAVLGCTCDNDLCSIGFVSDD